MLETVLGPGTSGDWLGYLVAVSLRGAVLLGLVGGAAWLCRRRSAGFRHLLWTLGLAALAGLTALAWALPTWRVEGLPIRGAWVVAMSGDPALGIAAGGASALGPAGASVSPAQAAEGAAAGWWSTSLIGPVLVGLWLAGALWLMVRHWRSLLAAHRLVRHASACGEPRLVETLAALAARLGVGRPIALRLSPALRSPFTVGVLRPTIVLPEEARDWPADLLGSVLAHEVAHVKRHDCALQLGAELLRAIHWMNPLSWLAVRRLGAERELACDDQVLAQGTRPSEYASHLLRLARHATLAPHGPPVGAAVASMVGSSGLGHRLVRLLDARHSHALVGRRAAVLAGLSLAVLAVPIACLSGDTPGEGHRLRLVYETSEAKAAETTEVVRRRLDELDLESVSVRRTGRLIEVEMSPVTEKQARRARELLPLSGELRFVVVKLGGPYLERLADEIQAMPDARTRGIRLELLKVRAPDGSRERTARHVEGPRQSLERLVRELPPTLAPEPGHRLLLEPVDAEGSRCRLVYVDDRRSLTLTRLANAEVAPLDSQRHEVRIELGAEDGARMQSLTAAHIGERLAIIVHGSEVWGAPMIQSAFGARVSVTMHGTAAEAERLAASFRAGALPAPLVLLEERRSGR